MAEAQADLHEAFLGAVGMLDHARTDLAAGDNNVVRDWWGGVDLSEPAAQRLTQRGEHGRLGRHMQQEATRKRKRRMASSATSSEMTSFTMEPKITSQNVSMLLHQPVGNEQEGRTGDKPEAGLDGLGVVASQR
jgi:hypothetical protein